MILNLLTSSKLNFHLCVLPSFLSARKCLGKTDVTVVSEDRKE